MRFSIGVLYLVVATFAAKAAGDIIAFSGNDCNGDEGEDVACANECIDFNTRHSFAVTASGTHCVLAFEDSNCNTLVGAITNTGSGQCSNVNTGTTVLSLRCSPTSVCTNVAGGNETVIEDNKKGLPAASSDKV